MKMKNQFRKIWIKWIDSHGYGTQWYSVNRALELCKTGPMICESVGYFLYEDEEQICCVESLAYDEEGDVCSMNGISGIPISCVIDWKWL